MYIHEYSHAVLEIPPERRGPFGVPELAWLAASAENADLPQDSVELLRLRSEGMTEDNAAAELGISHRTAVKIQRELFDSIGAVEGAHATRILIEAGHIATNPDTIEYPDLLTEHERMALDLTTRGYMISDTARLMQRFTGLVVSDGVMRGLLWEGRRKLEVPNLRPPLVRRAYEAGVLRRFLKYDVQSSQE